MNSTDTQPQTISRLPYRPGSLDPNLRDYLRGAISLEELERREGQRRRDYATVMRHVVGARERAGDE